ncbi:MAG: DoxX family protein [Solirubrobacterales bacterium]|nr:DoxX family protein [Solirubrobacterales bacterium]
MSKDPTSAARLGTALLFLGSGIMHFTHEKFYTAIVPKSLPNPKALVQISGVAEITGAVGVLIPGTRKLAGQGLIALLIAVFPANINMALNPDRFKQFPAWALWARLPLQFAAIVLVRRGTQQRSPE